MQEIDEKVDRLLWDISRLPNSEKRKAVIKFIENILQIESAPYLLDRVDLTYIRSVAVNEWHSKIAGQTMGGFTLSPEEITTIMWIRGVIMCLRKYKLLDRKVDMKFDLDFVYDSVHDD